MEDIYMKKHYCGVYMTGYASVIDKDLVAITERLGRMDLVEFHTRTTEFTNVIGIDLRFPVEKIVAIKKLMEEYGNSLGVLRFEN